MDAFVARLNAAEGSYFRSEQKSAVERHLQRLISEGKLPETALSAIKEPLLPGQCASQSLPTTVINSRPASEMVFQYKGIPVPRMSSAEAWARLGSVKVSLGNTRWSADGASIFSVQDGRRLAQTPVKQPSAWELNRSRKVAAASVDPRTVAGVRLMPEYTPARAMLWGTILALWGTGALVASIARGLDISSVEEASHKLRDVIVPYVDFSKQAVDPVRAWMHAQTTGDLRTASLPIQKLADKMREKLGHSRLS